MTMTDIKRKYNVEKLSFPIDNIYNYNVQVLTSVDGENYFYCGIGKFCRTEEEANNYITEYEQAHK
jgi:hypothetical protein